MTFCIFSGPRSSSSTVVIASIALHLRVLHQLLDVVDGCDRRAGQVEGRHDLVEIARANPAAQDAVELVAVVDALSGGLEPRLLGDVGAPDQPHHPLGDRGGAGGNGDPAAVAGEVGVARGVVGRAVAVPARHDLELVEHARAGAQDRQQRLDQRDVDHLAAAAVALPVVEREHHRDRPRQAGDAVGQPERRQRRRAVRLAGLVREAGHRLGERPERPPGGVGPGLAEPGHAQHHQRRVDLVQAVRAQAPLLHHAGAEVLDQDVGVGRQLLAAARGRPGATG